VPFLSRQVTERLIIAVEISVAGKNPIIINTKNKSSGNWRKPNKEIDPITNPSAKSIIDAA
ncbi:hypothetical protein SOO12_14110, partial [Staphylococcus aureus]